MKNNEDKYTAFEDIVETPTETSVVCYQSYKDIMSKHIELNVPHQKRNFEGIEFLKDRYDLLYYMTRPVECYKGKPITAKTRKSFLFDDICNELECEIKEGNTIFLYDLLYKYSYPSFYSISEETMLPVALQTPIISQDYWIIRYGILSMSDVT